MKHCYYFSLLFIVALLYACKPEKTNGLVGRIYGFKPVYSTSADLFIIENKPAQVVIHAGKIYVKDNFIFQNEVGEGVHIIDNTNPANAARVGFIKIKGSQEIAIKGNFLYSNNYNDLVTVDITDIAKVKEASRIHNAFYSTNSLQVPPAGGGYFECADNKKGVVIGWIKDSIDNPKCSN
ncbi:MAG: hypothetical protein H7334_06845 [Ferruginibacter sp.]|nr:hypothetical protein [Ferruginibacter sp.]